MPGIGGALGARIAQSMRKSKIDAARQMKQLIFEFSNPAPLPNLKVKKSYLINELRKVKIKGEKDYTEITFTKSSWSSIDAQVPLVNPQDIMCYLNITSINRDRN